MCNHLKEGRCAKCGKAKEVYKVEEMECDSPFTSYKPAKEYMLCRDCFRQKLCAMTM